jgi:hypothetical protein
MSTIMANLPTPRFAQGQAVGNRRTRPGPSERLHWPQHLLGWFSTVVASPTVIPRTVLGGCLAFSKHSGLLKRRRGVRTGVP